MEAAEFMDEWSMTEAWPIKVIRRSGDGIEIIEGEGHESRVLIHQSSIPKLIEALDLLRDDRD